MPLLYVVGEIKRCIESRTHVVRCAEKQSIEVGREREGQRDPLAVRTSSPIIRPQGAATNFRAERIRGLIELLALACARPLRDPLGAENSGSEYKIIPCITDPHRDSMHAPLLSYIDHIG